jgi:type IV secretory pathway VirB10-like protein
MNRKFLVSTLFMAAAATLTAQQGAYQGTSNPPPDDTIIDNTPSQPAPAPIAKPPAAQYAAPAPMSAQPQQQQMAAPMQSAPVQPAIQPAQSPNDVTGTDDGIVQVAPDTSQPGAQPELNHRNAVNDPDGDIVQPAALPPGELGQGTEIRARLLDRLSTAMNQQGDAFHARVASDVYQGSQVLIPTGSEIDGTIVQVSSGRAGGHGSMLLRPETVILPDGSRFRLYAATTGTPGSRTRVGSEGTITPGSRLKKDGIEYGGAVGAGAITGAIVAGPVGALAGTLIGAGAITVHLLVDHPQATLEEGTVLLFSLTEPLNLAPAVQPALPQSTPQPIASN